MQDLGKIFNDETIIFIRHYFALILVILGISQLPEIRSASSGNRFKINYWRFMLSLILVLLVEGILIDKIPNYARLGCFVVAFYSEEIYDYLKNGIFGRILKHLEDKYLKRKK